MARKRKKKTAASLLLGFLFDNVAGNIVFFFLLFSILIGINLLFSRNQYLSFILLCGIELLLLIPILGLVAYWRKR